MQQTISTGPGTVPRRMSPNSTAQAEYEMFSAMPRAAPMTEMPL